jgi:MFS family permease
VSREPELPRGGPDQDPDDRPPPPGRVRTTSAAAVAGFAVVGLVLGWLLRPVSVEINGTAPTVSWLPAVTLLFVALIVGWLAWSTFRTVHRRREHLEPHHAVNRLVLAKACTLGGALVAGAYAGYAISWVGLTEAMLARERMLHAALAALAGVALVVGALLLERACRTRRDDP